MHPAPPYHEEDHVGGERAAHRRGDDSERRDNAIQPPVDKALDVLAALPAVKEPRVEDTTERGAAKNEYECPKRRVSW